MRTTALMVVWSVIVAGLALGDAVAEQFVYPAKGQTPEQTDKDKYDCYQWAKQQTGFDPAQPPPPPASASSGQKSGQVVKGGAAGAGIGAVGGAIAGDAGKGAAIGAASGALIGGVKKRKDTKETQQTQQQQQAAASNAKTAYDRAYKACLEGKGYSVQ